MKICILSDSHDNRLLLKTGVREAKRLGAEAVLHCGDIVAPTTLRAILEFELPMHVIHGNNVGDTFNMSQLAANSNGLLRYHGQDAGIELAGRRIFLVHYPHYARAMATTGDWDIVCCGHDHRTLIEHIPHVRNGETVLLNPGTVAGVGAEPTFILADLASMDFEICTVPVEEELAYNRPSVTPHQ